jgi:hypothetical protein
MVTTTRIAVLEQPSPGRMTSRTLGRRNIALVQSTELNDLLPDHPKVKKGCTRRHGRPQAAQLTFFHHRYEHDGRTGRGFWSLSD